MYYNFIKNNIIELKVLHKIHKGYESNNCDPKMNTIMVMIY